MRERWILETKKADFDGLAAKLSVPPLLVRCMVNRGLETEEEMRRYLYGGLEDLHDPRQMKGVLKAVELLRQAEARGEKAGIASDFDCDGIFSAYILWLGFRQIGLTANIYTPDRIIEGYGLNRRIVNEAKAAGGTVLVTCDNGIAANEEVAYAKEQGMTVIVTDHHEVQEELPPADVVVDPKQDGETYPFCGLCGAGVAFKLICALYDACGVAAEEKWKLLEYTAIATVADVMELRDENRILVKYGLQQLEKTSHVGLRALLEVQGMAGKRLNAGHIGFVIGPCFNAAGRISTVSASFDLLMETEYGEALKKAQKLKEINETRKEMTEEGVKQASAMLEGKPLSDVLVLLLPDVHESLAGIVAGRIKENTGHPVIVFTRISDSNVKGSGRSIEAYHMFHELLSCKDLMSRFGGHKMAAGMTLPEANLPELTRRLNEQSVLLPEDFCPVVRIDAPMPVGFATERLVEEFGRMEPFGVGNPKPVFAEQHFSILRAQQLGKDGNVLKMYVQNCLGNRCEAMLFRGKEEFEQFLVENFGGRELKRMYEGKENDIDVAFTYFPIVNEFRGSRTVQIQVSGYCRIE